MRASLPEVHVDVPAAHRFETKHRNSHRAEPRHYHSTVGYVDEGPLRYLPAMSRSIEEIELAEREGSTAALAEILCNAAWCHETLSDYPGAMSHLEVARGRNDIYRMAHRLESIASNYKERGEYDAALDALNEALGIFRTLQAAMRRARSRFSGRLSPMRSRRSSTSTRAISSPCSPSIGCESDGGVGGDVERYRRALPAPSMMEM